MTSAAGAATKVSCIADDGEPVTVDFGRVDAGRVVRSRPVRIPVSRAGQRNYSGLYWSSTTQAHPAYESLLERDRLLLADFCPAVEWDGRSALLDSRHDGTRFRHNVPDLLLQHRNGAFTVVAVKPERTTKKPKVIDVLKWTDRVCRESGWHYEVWSGTNPTELSNVRFLSLAKRSRFVDRGSQLRVTDIDVTVTIAFDALCQQVDDSVRISLLFEDDYDRTALVRALRNAGEVLSSGSALVAADKADAGGLLNPAGPTTPIGPDNVLLRRKRHPLLAVARSRAHQLLRLPLRALHATSSGRRRPTGPNKAKPWSSTPPQAATITAW